MFRFACLLCLVLLAAPAQQSLTIRSGTGMVGGPDAMVTRLDGPLGGFQQPLVGAAFINAANGLPAQIVAPAGGWSPSLSTDPAAQWICTDQVTGNAVSALYAVSFFVSEPVIVQATMDLSVLVDDFLGDAFNEGAFINGQPVPGTATMLFSAWTTEQAWTGVDVTALLQTGFNTLFLNAANGGVGAGGLCFSATFQVTGKPTLTELAPFQLGSFAGVQLAVPPASAGWSYLTVPSLTPPVAAGTGLAIGTSGEFLLPLGDPLIGLALDPVLGSLFFTGVAGTISPVTTSSFTLIALPADPSLAGIPLHWQSVVLDAAAPQTIDSSNVLVTPLL